MADLSHLSDEELLKLAGGSAPQAPAPLAHLSDEELLKMSQPQEEPGLGSKLVSGSERVLNIPAAVGKSTTLGTLTEGIGRLRGKDETEYLKELAQAATGKDVPSEEYLRRMGWENSTADPNAVAGGKWGVTKVKNPESPRQMVGSVMDVGYQMVAPEVMGSKLEQIGKAIYRNPFKRMDVIAEAQNKLRPSEIFWNEGKTPLTKSGIQEGAEDILSTKTAQRNALEKPLMESTETGNIDTALAKARAKVEQLNNSGSVYDRQLGAKLEQDLNAQQAVFDKAQPTYSQLMDVKKGAGNSVKWGGESGSRSEDAFLKAMGGGAREESYSIANKVSPGLGQKIHATNQEISSMISVLPEAERKAMVEAGKHGVTQVDWMLAAHPEVFIPKQVGKAFLTPGASTVSGRAIHGVGKAIRPSTYGNILKKLGE